MDKNESMREIRGFHSVVLGPKDADHLTEMDFLLIAAASANVRIEGLEAEVALLRRGLAEGSLQAAPAVPEKPTLAWSDEK